MPSTPSPRGSAGARTPYHELEKKAISADATLKEVQKEFDIYRKEKCENERMVTEELQKAREELTETRYEESFKNILRKHNVFFFPIIIVLLCE